MTIEVTDEMVEAFVASGVDESEFLLADTRAGLAAVLAIVERDHLPKAQLLAQLAGQQANITTSLAEAAGLLTELAQACAAESLTLKRFEVDP